MKTIYTIMKRKNVLFYLWIIENGVSSKSFLKKHVRNQVTLTLERFRTFCISMNSRSSSLTLCTYTARRCSGYIFLICIAAGNTLLPWRLHLLFHHFQDSIAASWLPAWLPADPTLYYQGIRLYRRKKARETRCHYVIYYMCGKHFTVCYISVI